MEMYGSLQNRLMENRTPSEEIKVGTGMTEYLWSDRRAYEVTRVVDQKHLYVREYDHKHIGEPYANDWELISNPDAPERYITKRGNYWYWTSTQSSPELENLTDEDWEKLAACGVNVKEAKKSITPHTVRTRANVSFGVAHYYYDYTF